MTKLIKITVSIDRLGHEDNLSQRHFPGYALFEIKAGISSNKYFPFSNAIVISDHFKGMTNSIYHKSYVIINDHDYDFFEINVIEIQNSQSRPYISNIERGVTEWR